MPVTVFSRGSPPLQRGKLKKSLEALLCYSGRPRAWLEISLVDNRTMSALNRRYLKHRGVTDVLSFPLGKTPGAPGVPRHLGEIVVATAVARGQARLARRSLTRQVIRLAIHGLVHLEGFDHARGAREKSQFEIRERRYLKYLAEKGLLKWDGSLQF